MRFTALRTFGSRCVHVHVCSFYRCRLITALRFYRLHAFCYLLPHVPFYLWFVPHTFTVCRYVTLVAYRIALPLIFCGYGYAFTTTRLRICRYVTVPVHVRSRCYRWLCVAPFAVPAGLPVAVTFCVAHIRCRYAFVVRFTFRSGYALLRVTTLPRLLRFCDVHALPARSPFLPATYVYRTPAVYRRTYGCTGSPHRYACVPLLPLHVPRVLPVTDLPFCYHRLRSGSVAAPLPSGSFLITLHVLHVHGCCSLRLHTPFTTRSLVCLRLRSGWLPQFYRLFLIPGYPVGCTFTFGWLRTVRVPVATHTRFAHAHVFAAVYRLPALLHRSHGWICRTLDVYFTRSSRYRLFVWFWLVTRLRVWFTAHVTRFVLILPHTRLPTVPATLRLLRYGLHRLLRFTVGYTRLRLRFTFTVGSGYTLDYLQLLFCFLFYLGSSVLLMPFWILRLPRCYRTRPVGYRSDYRFHLPAFPFTTATVCYTHTRGWLLARLRSAVTVTTFAVPLRTQLPALRIHATVTPALRTPVYYHTVAHVATRFWRFGYGCYTVYLAHLRLLPLRSVRYVCCCVHYAAVCITAYAHRLPLTVIPVRSGSLPGYRLPSFTVGHSSGSPHGSPLRIVPACRFTRILFCCAHGCRTFVTHAMRFTRLRGCGLHRIHRIRLPLRRFTTGSVYLQLVGYVPCVGSVYVYAHVLIRLHRAVYYYRLLVYACLVRLRLRGYLVGSAVCVLHLRFCRLVTFGLPAGLPTLLTLHARLRFTTFHHRYGLYAVTDSFVLTGRAPFRSHRLYFTRLRLVTTHTFPVIRGSCGSFYTHVALVALRFFPHTRLPAGADLRYYCGLRTGLTHTPHRYIYCVCGCVYLRLHVLPFLRSADYHLCWFVSSGLFCAVTYTHTHATTVILYPHLPAVLVRTTAPHLIYLPFTPAATPTLHAFCRFTTVGSVLPGFYGYCLVCCTLPAVAVRYVAVTFTFTVYPFGSFTPFCVGYTTPHLRLRAVPVGYARCVLRVHTFATTTVGLHVACLPRSHTTPPTVTCRGFAPPIACPGLVYCYTRSVVRSTLRFTFTATVTVRTAVVRGCGFCLALRSAVGPFTCPPHTHAVYYGYTLLLRLRLRWFCVTVPHAARIYYRLPCRGSDCRSYTCGWLPCHFAVICGCTTVWLITHWLRLPRSGLRHRSVTTRSTTFIRIRLRFGLRLPLHFTAILVVSVTCIAVATVYGFLYLPVTVGPRFWIHTGSVLYHCAVVAATRVPTLRLPHRTRLFTHCRSGCRFTCGSSPPYYRFCGLRLLPVAVRTRRYGLRAALPTATHTALVLYRRPLQRFWLGCLHVYRFTLCTHACCGCAVCCRFTVCYPLRTTARLCTAGLLRTFGLHGSGYATYTVTTTTFGF